MDDKRSNEGPLGIELDAGEHRWCPCGWSSTYPICDRTAHKGSGISSHRFTLAEKQTVHLCRCGRTGNRPFCDGSHRHP